MHEFWIALSAIALLRTLDAIFKTGPAFPWYIYSVVAITSMMMGQQGE